MKDYYKVLHIVRSASQDDIKRSFKELALEYHPDVCKLPDAHQKFIEINEAHQILSDKNKKIQYDQLYDRFHNRSKAQIREDHIRENIVHWARKAKEKATRDSKIKYKDYIKNLNCYFSESQKADGSPYYYYVHKSIAIRGGVGPMGSIKSRVIVIPIPRSKKALNLHHIAFFIKLFFLLAAVLGLVIPPFSHLSWFDKTRLCLSLLLMGGFITYGLYSITNTKAIAHYAKQYYLVRKYRKKGYTSGFHPVISASPFIIIYYLTKWLL